MNGSRQDKGQNEERAYICNGKRGQISLDYLLLSWEILHRVSCGAKDKISNEAKKAIAYPSTEISRAASLYLHQRILSLGPEREKCKDRLTVG